MSGQRQPVELLLVKGRKHLTKNEVAERKAREIRAPSDKVRPPSYLGKELKKEFNKIAKELLRLEIMSNLDVDALARFLYARQMYLRLTAELLDRSPISEGEDIEAFGADGQPCIKQWANGTYLELLQAQDKLFKQCRQSASDLGLTISSRCRLVMPKKEVIKEPSKEEKLFGDRL